MRSPAAWGSAASQPMFERLVRTGYGALHLRRYRLDADASTFGGLAPVVALWQAKRSGDSLPRWRDFEIREFVGWHHNLALSDIGAESADPRFRIFGTGAAELIGADLTGKRLTEVVPAAGPDGVIEHFAALRDGRLIGLLSGNVGRPGLQHRKFMVVELPLQNDAGEVAQILHCFFIPTESR